MEFEQMQKIWIEKTNEPFYGFNQDALCSRIIKKAKSSGRLASITELITILVNLLAGLFILIINFQAKGNQWLYLTSAWMLATAAYGIYHRSRRQELNPVSSAKISDHLTRALHSATHQVRLSWLMRLNIIPVAILTSAGLWASGKPGVMVIGILLFFLFCFYFSGWEHMMYVRKKKELETLKATLDRPE